MSSEIRKTYELLSKGVEIVIGSNEIDKKEENIRSLLKTIKEFLNEDSEQTKAEVTFLIALNNLLEDALGDMYGDGDQVFGGIRAWMHG